MLMSTVRPAASRGSSPGPTAVGPGPATSEQDPLLGRIAGDPPKRPRRSREPGSSNASGSTVQKRSGRRAGLRSTGDQSLQQPDREADPLSGPRGTTDHLVPDHLAFGYSIGLAQFAPDMPRGISLYKDAESAAIAGSDLLDFAGEMIALGVLKESDWLFDGNQPRKASIKADLKDAIECGMYRWVNEELGGKNLKVFSKLRFEYFNDARSYFRSLDDGTWRQEMSAVPHRPIGFFGFSWQQDGFDPIFVAEKVTELETAFPGLGYGLCALLGYAFRWSVHGIGFDESYAEAHESEMKMRLDFLERELRDADASDLDGNGNPPAGSFLKEILEERWTEALADSDDTTLTTVRYHELIPQETHGRTPHGELLPAVCREMEGIEIRGFRDGRAVGARRINNSKLSAAQRAKRKYAGIVKMIMDLQVLINNSTRTHIGADHLSLIRNGEHLQSKNRSVYLAWHPADETHRIADDLNNTLAYSGSSDLVWAKGFQLSHKGSMTGEARRLRAGIDAMRPDLSEGFGFARDGSLEAAVAGVKRFMEITCLVDEILQWLHTPQVAEADQEIEKMRVRVYNLA